MEKCVMRESSRDSSLSSWRWAKCLLTRADFSLWRLDVEFVATLYNVFLRRDQINAVEASWRSLQLNEANRKELELITASSLVATALASGDVNSVRDVLRKKNLEKPVQAAMQQIQISLRNVRGSESERDNLMPKFLGMRLWSGCASLFFTLNPHDVRSPITISLLQNDIKFEKTFSLDLSDVEADACIGDICRDNPRKLHEAVAANPLAATRCFHWTVRLVIRTLFNCQDVPGGSVDNIAAKECPGIFGHVRAYFGVVEPQMRKALHTHMLIYLLGFSHPETLFGSGVLPDVFRRLWYFVASVSFRSTEAFASHLQEPVAMERMQQLPLLPLTQKQRGMIGEARTHSALRAQLEARGLHAIPESAKSSGTYSYFPSEFLVDPTMPSAMWAVSALNEVSSSTLRTGNHVCRPDVCYKGRIGRKGFCRMYYWHWCKQRDVAKRAHGLELQPRWDGTGAPPVYTSPPFLGAPRVEITHPFHN